MLTLCRPDKVLVLHLRGASNKHSSDVLLSALYLVREACLRNQPIHLHSLTGFQHDVEEWLQEFPNCYFGFTGKAPSFSSEQLFDLQSVFIMMWKSGCRKSPTATLDLPGKFPASAVNNSGLQSVPAKRLLNETDSPYMPVHRDVKTNTPAHIGDVAQLVARALEVAVEDLLAVTLHNSRMLYA